MEERQRKEEVVVFCGSFNPPQNSHFLLAQQVANEYERVKKVIMVPVNSKYDKPGLIGNEHRYNMLKMVCDKNDKFGVSRIEIDSSRPLYTIETLSAFQEKYPQYDIAFILGSDNLKTLHKWRNPDELLDRFKVYVTPRDEDNVEQIIQSSDFLKRHRESIIETKDCIITNLSSTHVRECLARGKSINYMAPPEVVEYIERNKLYAPQNIRPQSGRESDDEAR